MNSQLQQLVKRIFSDESTQAQFKSDPESVISQYKLNDTEKRAVLITHSKLCLATSSAQPGNEVGPMESWF